eukprot:scaffold558079_cov15-Prasinocladus_malaysianus.AAC.2
MAEFFPLNDGVQLLCVLRSKSSACLSLRNKAMQSTSANLQCPKSWTYLSSTREPQPEYSQ